MLDLLQFEKLIYEEPKKEVKRMVSKEFFKKFRHRYLINIIFSFLTKEEKLSYHLLCKTYYNAFILDKDFEVNFQ